MGQDVAIFRQMDYWCLKVKIFALDGAQFQKRNAHFPKMGHFHPQILQFRKEIFVQEDNFTTD